MLQGADETLKKVNAAYLEINTKEVYKNCGKKNQIEELLANYNFVPLEEKVFQQWGWGDQFFLKRKSEPTTIQTAD